MCGFSESTWIVSGSFGMRSLACLQNPSDKGEQRR